MKRALVAAAIVLVPRVAQADEYRNVVEVDVEVGYARTPVPRKEHASDVSSRNGGLALAIGAAYRTPYFLAPFVELGFVQLYGSERSAQIDPAYELATSKSSLSAWSASAGLAFDVWRLRLRGGVGAYDLVVRSSVAGQRLMTTEIDMGYLFALGGTVYQRDWLRIGLDLRAGLIVDAETGFLALGITGSFDAIRWGAPQAPPP